MSRKRLTYDYTVHMETVSGDEIGDYEGSKDIFVEESFDDVFEYHYEKRYGHKYNPMNWYLDEGAKEMYKEMESLWLSNKIDTFGLYYHDRDFNDFLIDKYSDEAASSIEESFMSKLDESMLDEDALCYSIQGDGISISSEVYNGRC